MGDHRYNTITYPTNEGGRPPDALYVLTADCSTGDGYCYQAFFFKGGRYLGTATKKPVVNMLNTVRVGSVNTVSLGYPQYAPGDPFANPTQGVKWYSFTYAGGNSVQPNPPLPANGELNGHLGQ